MTEVGREGLRVYAGGDHQRGERVPTLVEPDRLELRSLPRSSCTAVDGRGIERQVRSSTEQEPLSVAAHPVLGQVVAEHRRDWNGPPSGSAFRLDRPFPSCPRLARLESTLPPGRRRPAGVPVALPFERPAYMAVAHRARSLGSSAPTSSAASSGDAILS